MTEKRYLRSAKSVFLYLLAVSLLFPLLLLARQTYGEVDPENLGPCSILSQEVVISGMTTVIFHPQSGTCANDMTNPFPAVVFAHGFSMFGISDGASENLANGEHLASWGYVVAIPSLPDDADARSDVLMATLDFLQSATKDPKSFLFQKVDPKRLVTAGHSLGGATALAVAARDERVQAVLALDPVYHTGGFIGEGDPIWDPVAEGSKITVPVGILGAPASSCNAEADYADIFPLLGAKHKASYHLVGASHCVFSDPGSSFCGWICDGIVSEQMTTLSQKYMTAWFNYYVQLQPLYYDYLYGPYAQADESTNDIIIIKDNAPNQLQASVLKGAVELQWESYDHPIINGYHIYRRLSEDPAFSQPLATVGITSLFRDNTVVAGEEYVYAIASYDTANNRHELSNQVTILFEPGKDYPVSLFLPLVKVNE